MIYPKGTRVLVKRLDPERVKSELLEVVEYNPKPSLFGMVIAVGKLVHSTLNAGDVVILSDYSGAPVEVALVEGDDPMDAIIVNEEDVLAVVEGMI